MCLCIRGVSLEQLPKPQLLELSAEKKEGRWDEKSRRDGKGRRRKRELSLWKGFGNMGKGEENKMTGRDWEQNKEAVVEKSSRTPLDQVWEGTENNTSGTRFNIRPFPRHWSLNKQVVQTKHTPSGSVSSPHLLMPSPVRSKTKVCSSVSPKHQWPTVGSDWCQELSCISPTNTAVSGDLESTPVAKRTRTMSCTARINIVVTCLRILIYWKWMNKILETPPRLVWYQLGARQETNCKNVTKRLKTKLFLASSLYRPLCLDPPTWLGIHCLGMQHSWRGC